MKLGAQHLVILLLAAFLAICIALTAANQGDRDSAYWRCTLAGGRWYEVPYFYVCEGGAR